MGIKEQTNSTSSNKDDNIDANKVGQGELYYPHHAINLQGNNSTTTTTKTKGKDMGVATDIKRNLGVIKERVAAAAVPADTLENARHFLEGVVRDVTVAAHGLTKDALHRIKTHLVDILPSLSPAITRKVEKKFSLTKYKQMVDDVEKEGNGERECEEEEEGEAGHQQKQEHHQQQFSGKSPYVSPTSSLLTSRVKPLSRL